MRERSQDFQHASAAAGTSQWGLHRGTNELSEGGSIRAGGSKLPLCHTETMSFISDVWGIVICHISEWQTAALLKDRAEEEEDDS